MKNMFWIIVFALNTIVSYGQKKELSIAEQNNDLKLLREKLDFYHPTLYRFCTKAALDSVFNLVKSQITKVRSSNEFGKLILPIILSIRNSHTYLEIPADTNNKIFPIDIKIFSGRLYIYQNLSANPHIQEGAEIVEINNVPAQVILSELKRTVTADGYIETTRERTIEGWFRYFYPLIYGNPDFFSLKTRFNEGETKTEKVMALVEKDIELYRVNKHKKPPVLSPPFYSFKIIENKNAAVIRLVDFSDIPQNEYFKFIDSCFIEVEKNKINNLIIDLRWNVGGPRNYPLYLYSKISEIPFGYCKEQIVTSATLKEVIAWDSTAVFEKLNDSFYSIKKLKDVGMGVQNSSNNPYKGKVFLLIDGQSGSGSAQFASLLYYNKRGTIVGEEAGGVYSGSAGGVSCVLKLPSSEITVNIPKTWIVLDVDDKEFYGHGVKPHYEVKEDIKSFFNGRDNILKFTLDLVK